jgi:hypothetical protein
LNRRESEVSPRVIQLHGDKYDPLRTLAVMHAPDDDGFRRAFFATNYIRGNEWDMPGPPVLIEREVLAALIDAPSHEQMRTDTRQRVREGMVAGYILVATFLMWKYPALLGSRKIGGASLNKAFHVCEYLGSELQWPYGDGSVLPGGETKIKECWRRFRPAAHFWAAHAWDRAFPLAGPMVIHEDLFAFLSAVRYFQMFGSEHLLDNKASKKADTVLGSDFWRVPESVKAELPLPDDPTVLNESPLTAALRSYAAK